MKSQEGIPVSDATFARLVLAAQKPVMIHFWATWCPPCRALAPIIEEITREHPELRDHKLDVDANPQAAARFAVQSIPT